MNLNEDDIRKAIINYMEDHNKKNYEMAEMCGMSSPSMFSQYRSGITKTLRAEYLINFLFNSKTDINKFLFKNISGSILEENDKSTLEEPNVEVYTCPNCFPRVKKIREQNEQIKILKDEKDALKDELLQCYRDKKGNATANSA